MSYVVGLLLCGTQKHVRGKIAWQKKTPPLPQESILPSDNTIYWRGVLHARILASCRCLQVKRLGGGYRARVSPRVRSESHVALPGRHVSDPVTLWVLGWDILLLDGREHHALLPRSPVRRGRDLMQGATGAVSEHMSCHHGPTELHCTEEATRAHLMGGGHLNRLQDPEDLVKIAARGGRIPSDTVYEISTDHRWI